MRAGRKAQAALESAALMIDAVDKLTGAVEDLNERHGSLVMTVGSLAGQFEMALAIERVTLDTLIELCREHDRTDLLVRIRDSLQMVQEAMDTAEVREGGPDL